MEKLKKPKMKFDTAEQFDRVFPAIANELTYATLCYNMFMALNSSFTEYQREVNNSPAFWGIARDSIRDVAFLSLCRVYDPEPNANSLRNLLITISNDSNFIDKIKIIKDSSENQRILPNPSATIDTEQLYRDIAFTTEENPAVKRLIKWRGNIFVHSNAANLASGKGLAAEHIPKYEDFESLLKDGMKIVNRYADLFRATEYSTFFGQGDDYTFVLDSVRENLRLHKERIEAEFEKYGVKRGTFDEENDPISKLPPETE